MNLLKPITAAFLACIPLTSLAWGMHHTVSGSVTADGRPMEGVVVSDGFNCTATDAAGRYSLTVNDRARHITVSTPSGYLAPLDSLCRPIFYHPLADSIDIYDFSLIKNPKDDRRHAFMTQADIQVVSEDELCIYDRQVVDARNHFEQYADRDIFGIDCGDVVGDHPELYPSSLRHRAGLGFPLYIVNGNHDMRYGPRTHEYSTDRFEACVGPNTYSFNRGDIHYIFIDNCFYIGRDYFYMGYVDERTFDWLEQDLSYVPEGSTVVVCMHIPVSNEAELQPFTYNGTRVADETVNGSHLIRLLAPYNTHFITGHQHWSRNIVFNDRCFEHNTPGACGMWWDVDMCSDGTPQGYGVYIVDGSDIRWYFKSTGHDVDYQFRAYPAGADKDRPGEIIVNVWNYDPLWRVEWLEDGVVMGEMTRFDGKDPLTVERVSDRSKLRYSWIGAAVSPHMFAAKPVNPNAKISVRVTDRFGNVYSQNL